MFLDSFVFRIRTNLISFQDDDLPVPPAKGYNLDFLEDLDDASFNPFKTVTAIKDTFATSTINTADKE